MCYLVTKTLEEEVVVNGWAFIVCDFDLMDNNYSLG